MHWPGFFTRLGSAVVFCGVMLLGLRTGPAAYGLLLILIQGLCIREFFALFKRIPPTRQIDRAGVALVQGLALALAVMGFIFPALRFPLWGAAMTSVWLLGYLMPRFGGSLGGPLPLTFLFIIWPILSGFALYELDDRLPLILVLLIWTNDTMAYISGSFFGKTPFTELSPKKTWEGTLGGGMLCLVAASLIPVIWPDFSLLPTLGFAALIVISGTFGDLLESKMKRQAGVKDSGRMMPGHGGALDRFDSLLAALPVAYAYAYIWYFMMG